MGAKVQQTGGGANVGTSNAWNQFLNQQLTGGAQPSGPTGAFMPGVGSLDPTLQGMINQGVSNSQQPQQQQQGFQQAFQGMLGGNVRDVSGAGAALSNYFQNQPAHELWRRADRHGESVTVRNCCTGCRTRTS